LAQLAMLPKRASEPMQKLLRSALANATEREGVSAADLYVSKIEVNGGVVFKRSMPRARGRASMIKKRTSHITLSLAQKGKPKTQAPNSKAEAAK